MSKLLYMINYVYQAWSYMFHQEQNQHQPWLLIINHQLSSINIFNHHHKPLSIINSPLLFTIKAASINHQFTISFTISSSIHQPSIQHDSFSRNHHERTQQPRPTPGASWVVAPSDFVGPKHEAKRHRPPAVGPARKALGWLWLTVVDDSQQWLIRWPTMVH